MRAVEHIEGRTRLLVPEASIAEDPPPTSPVFFNPAASLNRDVTVAVTSAAGGETFCDSMAGVGARGLRVAKEVDAVKRVTMVDFNAEAVGLARRSAKANGVGRKCEFAVSETSSYLYSRYGSERRFDFVDVDPFGTPVRQLQAALAATSDGGVLSTTATDTAVLCGVYPKVSLRRYGAEPLNNSYHNETAVRILVGAITRLGGAIDLGVRPVAAHATRHYLRVFVRVLAGASKADAALASLGFILFCPRCGNTEQSDGTGGTCGECGARARRGGPLWVGALTDQKLVRAAGGTAAGFGLPRAVETLASLEGVDGFPPWSFSIEGACSALGVPTVPELLVYRGLDASGHPAMRTPFEKTGVKTPATHREFLGAVKAAARG